MLLGILFVQGAPLRGQQQGTGQAPAPAALDVPAQEAVPVFRSGINFVRVDVIVTDRKGEPVDDLTAADFEVREDGAVQTVEQFKLIRVDRSQRPADEPLREIRDRDDVEREAAYDDVRLFVFFFDDYHTRDINAMTIRRHLHEFASTRISPKDLVAFMYPLSPLDTVTFTRNAAVVSNAIERFVGRKYKYDPLNAFEQRYANYPTEQVEAIRNQVVVTALRGLATHLGGIRDGRKAIIYVGEGLSTSLPPSMRNQDAQFTNPVTTRQDSPFEETAAFFNYSDVLRRLGDVIDAANRTNTSVYTVDPRGLAVSEFQIDEIASFESDRRILQQTQDTLRTLAEGTDGRAIVGRNDLARGLAQMVRDSSAYYLMGYNSTQAPADGKFHAIKVTLSERARKRGLQVRARRGYLAPTPEDVRRVTAAPKPPLPKPVEQAVSSLSARAGAHEVVRDWLGVARGTGTGSLRVTYLWEALPGVPGTRREVPGRVSLIAATPGGTVVFRGKVPAASPRTPGVGAGLAAGSVSFEAPPGRLQLRISVESVAGAVLDSQTREYPVPEMGGGVSTPRVYRARTVREAQAALQDVSVLPVVSREFSRAERVVVRFEAYGDARPSVVLLNRNAQRMAEVPVQGGVAPAFHVDLPLGALAAGEYLLEISAGSSRELIPLKVGT